VTFALGSALTAWLGSYRLVLTLIGVSILLFLGLRTLVTNIRLFRTTEASELPHSQPRSLGATYLTFVSATAINPPTALYFLAIAPSIGPLAGDAPWLGAAVFALGVFVASVGWGNALAAVGTGLRQITTNRVRAALGILGGALIVVLAFGLAANAFNA
jgi:threonine/homoserine/homoserine lactone efflux protein